MPRPEGPQSVCEATLIDWQQHQRTIVKIDVVVVVSDPRLSRSAPTMGSY